VPLGERHLRRAVSEFADHYHRERNHQGLENRLIEDPPEPANLNGRVVRVERLGGLLNFYHREAAWMCLDLVSAQEGVVRLPARSPNLNAFAERFVLSIKTECLNRIVPLGERHLRRAVGEFVAHYHGERNHQGLENCLIDQAPKPANTNGQILRRERLGGLLNYYERQAA
jgi:Integrase core domain